MHKQIQFKTTGMQRDLSESAFNPKFAYENRNIRIVPTDDNTLFSIVNEKGNKQISIEGIGDTIEGTPIGQAVIANEWIIFTTGDRDIIYKLWFENDILKGNILYSGNLNFSIEHPIETLVFYENDDIKKVYWVDGLNQPRVINIASDDSVIAKWNDKSFDFVSSLQLKETVHISRSLIANGVFAPGVLQYVFTYYNKYGQESNIFYASPLYYVSFNNRGASPEDKVSNSFDIEISDLDTSFDYLRIYSIHRSSIDATPEVKRVVDLPIEGESSTLNYTDSGTAGDFIDPTELLYVGGEEVIFGTLAQKDNTLFLGDFTLKRRLIDKDTREFFKGKPISFNSYTKTLASPEPKGSYPYNNQLKLNSYEIKTFKYLEWYRFGVQLQHYTGKWSEPVWINDTKNTKSVGVTFYNDNDVTLPIAEFNFNDTGIINKLINQGYIKIRPVIVYPTINDREVICQGILCPTVYNVSDRYGNSPFAQSSWFTRPNIPFDINKATQYNQSSTGEWGADYFPLGKFIGDPTIYSRKGIINNDASIVNDTFLIDTINKGAWAEFRHNYPIPNNDQRNAEIQCIFNAPNLPEVGLFDSDTDISKWVAENSEYFYVDQSIVTLHSPDIEFDEEVQNLDTTDFKLRIVGAVPLTAFSSDIDIQTSTPPNLFKKDNTSAIGFYKEHIGVENDFDNYIGSELQYGNSYFGYRGLISGAFWFDDLSNYKDVSNDSKLTTGFVVYPWHRNGSLNNAKYSSDGYTSAMLSKKKMSNLRYSYKTEYFKPDSIWNAYEEGNSNKTGISGVSVFNSNEVSLIKIPKPANSRIGDINYYGNIDKVVTVSRFGSKKEGYPIMTTGTLNAEDFPHQLFTGKYLQVESSYTDDITGTDPVRIKYKSTPHAVLALNYTTGGSQRILPTIQDNDTRTTYWNINYVGDKLTRYFWDPKTLTRTSQDIIPSISGNINTIGGIQYGWLWLGELYNDNVKNRFGGQTEEAFENNQWLPCGDAISLIDENNNPKNSVNIQWSEGDTYYQRYDHIKTYPSSLEDQNSVTDIVSFMCETRVNIDGRYDRNRGQTSNLAITPENFNKLNPVYSQKNNFFNYRTINPNKLNLDNFHNSITWTKSKSSGELIDTWTNITLASVLDLDGDKGAISAIRRFNNNLIAFQDKGISQILYNENMQITSTEGIPIEIANSGKVSGKRYISDQVGCSNKYSICETPYGIYFVDDISKGIYTFDGKINNLTTKLGFDSWIKNNTSLNKWNPRDFSGFVTYYDKLNNDVLFINNTECLAYSEVLGQFTSFYNYEHTPYFINLNDKVFAINKDNGDKYKVWMHNAGDYNMFYGSYKPFYTTVIANPDISKDKIFNTLEFRADSWNKEGALIDSTFDTLKVWNEYQEGESDLRMSFGKPSSLKRKFRIWRANIPRDKSNNRDRIRNSWIYVKLSKNTENTDKTVLHDMLISYFE